MNLAQRVKAFVKSEIGTWPKAATIDRKDVERITLRFAEKLAFALEQSPTRCVKHDRDLICPNCMGARGGKKTARKYGDKLSDWGKQGGRPAEIDPKKT